MMQGPHCLRLGLRHKICTKSFTTVLLCSNSAKRFAKTAPRHKNSHSHSQEVQTGHKGVGQKYRTKRLKPYNQCTFYHHRICVHVSHSQNPNLRHIICRPVKPLNGLYKQLVKHDRGLLTDEGINLSYGCQSHGRHLILASPRCSPGSSKENQG